jgi:hypothetical protein
MREWTVLPGNPRSITKIGEKIRETVFTVNKVGKEKDYTSYDIEIPRSTLLYIILNMIEDETKVGSHWMLYYNKKKKERLRIIIT